MTQPVLAAAIAHHFESVTLKRIDDIVDRYWPDGETYVFVEGPRWSTLGHQRIAAGWRAFVGAPMQVRACTWVEGPQEQVVGDLGWIAGIVELHVDVRGRAISVRFRGTFVLRRSPDGAWRIVHEHFSQPAADPYGIGDWLPAAPPPA